MIDRVPTATVDEPAVRAIQNECLACWAHFCLKQRGVTGGTAASCSRVELPQIDRPMEGEIAAYFSGGKQMSCTLLLTSFGDSEPHSIASCDNGSIGSLRRGYCLFIPMSDEIKWTPDAWPTSIGELNALVDHVTNDPTMLETWLMKKRGESNQLRIVVLIHSDVCYGYLLGAPTLAGIGELHVIPIFFDRLGTSWAFAREQHLEILQRRRSLRALVLGCDSLSSLVIEQIARAGVGCIDIVDGEHADATHCAEQCLEADSIDLGKAQAMADRLQRLLPTTQVNAHRVKAERWVPSQCSPGRYDVVLDLTAEVSVRRMLVQYRSQCFADTPILHGWTEPFCVASHLILLAAGSDYPVEEPALGVNVGHWPTEALVQLPLGGLGFHPYGSVEVAQAAGFIAERSIAVIDGAVCESLVWSSVRSEGFFNKLGVGAVCSPCVPNSRNTFDSIQITRSFLDIYGA
ncbi:thiamine biosynthesis protein ThiF [compost metagenome]